MPAVAIRERRRRPHPGASSTPPSSILPPPNRPRWTCFGRSAPIWIARTYKGHHGASPPRWPSSSRPAEFAATTFPNEEHYDELVIVRDIPFHTLCMHHLLPFHGQAHVAYLPGERILGISKLARVVENFARDLQLQERMTVQIADWLEHELKPRGVGVVLSAEHTCMTMRGVLKPGARTVTSALRGSLRDDPGTRQELFSLVG